MVKTWNQELRNLHWLAVRQVIVKRPDVAKFTEFTGAVAPYFQFHLTIHRHNLRFPIKRVIISHLSHFPQSNRHSRSLSIEGRPKIW